jgi:hypothetical protein
MRSLAAIALFCLAATASAQSTDTARLVDDARNAALGMQKELAGKLMKEIEAKGPEGAIGVCSTLAPNAALEISRSKGWKVSRVSLKPRNALLGPADAWEQKVLLDFDVRAAKGENPGALEHFEVVDEPAGRQFRYMKALPVAPLCVSCHGPQDKLSPAIRERLAKDYPSDRATGYAPGQIRGAITIKRPL